MDTLVMRPGLLILIGILGGGCVVFVYLFAIERMKDRQSQQAWEKDHPDLDKGINLEGGWRPQ